VVWNVKELEVPKGTDFLHGNAGRLRLLAKTQKHKYLVEDSRVEHDFVTLQWSLMGT
jgi:hypothetical protein